MTSEQRGFAVSKAVKLEPSYPAGRSLLHQVMCSTLIIDIKMIEIIKNEQAGYTRAVDAQSQDRECEARRDCGGVSRIAHQRDCGMKACRIAS